MAEGPPAETGKFLGAEYPHIVFHNTATGKQAHVRGTGMSVWELIKLSRVFDGDTTAMAEHFEVDPSLIEEALSYARRYPDEIEAAIQHSESFDLDRLRTVLPHLEVFEPPDRTEQP